MNGASGRFGAGLRCGASANSKTLARDLLAQRPLNGRLKSRIRQPWPSAAPALTASRCSGASDPLAESRLVIPPGTATGSYIKLPVRRVCICLAVAGSDHRSFAMSQKVGVRDVAAHSFLRTEPAGQAHQ